MVMDRLLIMLGGIYINLLITLEMVVMFVLLEGLEVVLTLVMKYLSTNTLDINMNLLEQMI